MNETILYSKDDSVAHIVLNRPQVINAYNIQMRDELHQALEAVRDDPDVRVAVLRGVGDRGFCVGADLTEFGSAPSQVVARRVRWERDVWGLFLSIRKPLVAALHGYVIGSGVEIACLCDIRIASEDAVFGMPEVALGMVPAAGGTQTLPRTIGVGPALEMLLANRRIMAQDALRLGLVHKVVPKGSLLNQAEGVAQDLALVHKVVPKGSLLNQAEGVAQDLASRNPQAMAAAKAAILQGMDMPLAQALELEERLAVSLTGAMPSP